MHPPGDHDSAEDFEDREDEENKESGEENREDEEETAEKSLPAPFAGKVATPASAQSRKRFFAAQKEKVVEGRKRDRRRKLVLVAVPVAFLLLVAVAIGFFARRMYLESKTAEEKLARAAQAQEGIVKPQAGEVADDSDLAQSVATARKLLEERKTEDAKKLLAVMGRRFPKSPDVLVLQGWMLLDSTPASAGTFGRKALEYAPRHKEALDLVSTAFELTRTRGMSVENEIKLRDLEIKYYDALLERAPDWPELLYRLASQLIAVHRLEPSRKAQLERAIVKLEEAVAILSANESRRDLASAYYQLGRAVKHEADQLMDEGERGEAAGVYERALEEFNHALELDPNRVDALGEIILIHERREERELAVLAVEGALPGMEIPAARAKALEMQGVLFHKAGRLEEAERRYEEALEANEKMIGSLVGLAGIHVARGEPEKAREKFEESVRVDPNFIEGYYRAGQFFIEQEQPKDAIRSFEAVFRVPRQQARTIDMFPSKNLARSRYYYGAASALAWLYIEEERDPLKAGQAVELASGFQEPEAHLLDTVGWIYFRSGNYEKAAQTFESVIEASGGFPAAHFHLAASYAKLDRGDDALREVKRALEGDGWFSQRPEAEALRAELTGEFR